MDKPTEDITAIKQALVTDKDRIPESLLLLKKIDITPAPTPLAQRPATRVTVPLGSTGVHSSIECHCGPMNPVVLHFRCDNPPQEKVGFLGRQEEMPQS